MTECEARYGKCNRCGMKMPSAVIAMPASVKQARDPGQHDDAGDDGRRGQHDADLEGGGGKFEVMIFCGGKIALFLCMLGALGQLLLSFAGLGIGAVALGGLLPVVDLLLRAALAASSLAAPRPSLDWSAAVCTTVRRMLLAWKNAHRFEASTFLLIDSVWAPLPSVSDSARHSAMIAINSAIFRFSLEASLAWSACSMLSCALMILSPVVGFHDGPNDAPSARGTGRRTARY